MKFCVVYMRFFTNPLPAAYFPGLMAKFALRSQPGNRGPMNPASSQTGRSIAFLAFAAAAVSALAVAERSVRAAEATVLCRITVVDK
jgi:hypothetical protein